MANAEVGLSMLFCLGEPFSNLCQRLQRTTVTHVELVDEGWHALDRNRVRKLRKISESQGLKYTLHMPFANINIAAPAENMRRFIFKRLEKSMVFARQLECLVSVFHPGLRTGISGFYPGMDWKTNIESVGSLIRLSRKHGVRIAIENCPESYGFLINDTEQLSLFFNELEEDVDLVLDLGHANLNGQTGALIEAFGDSIVHIHAHDNDGKHDLHLGVGHGTVNWLKFSQDIKKSNFKGLVMVESYSNLNESITTLRKLLNSR